MPRRTENPRNTPVSGKVTARVGDLLQAEADRRRTTRSQVVSDLVEQALSGSSGVGESLTKIQAAIDKIETNLEATAEATAGNRRHAEMQISSLRNQVADLRDGFDQIRTVVIGMSDGMSALRDQLVQREMQLNQFMAATEITNKLIIEIASRLKGGRE